MEIIDKNDLEKIGENNDKVTNKELLETIEKGKGEELKQLLEGYFSMIDHLGELDYLVDNIAYFDETLSKLVDFSKTPFMEKSIWRVYANGEHQEYCGAHLRNLLSPFKNMIALIKDFSEGKFNEKLLNSFIKESVINFEENKRDFLKFCGFLG